MASFNKFQIFVQDVGQKVHNLNSDTLKIMLSNTAPAATDTVNGNETEISAGNGYVAGGATVASNAYTESSGTATLVGNAVSWTASGGSIGPFRYAILYNNAAGADSTHRPLIGWWDYGSSLTLNNGDSFKVAADSSGSNWSTGTPILSLA